MHSSATVPLTTDDRPLVLFVEKSSKRARNSKNPEDNDTLMSCCVQILVQKNTFVGQSKLCQMLVLQRTHDSHFSSLASQRYVYSHTLTHKHTQTHTNSHTHMCTVYCPKQNVLVGLRVF